MVAVAPGVVTRNSFYRPIAPKVAKSWVDRVAGRKRFKFTAKLWRRFTHERAEAWTKAEAAERIQEVAARTKETYAVTNNHNLGKAPAAAIMLETMISGGKVEVPEALLETYPKELQPYARP